MLNSNVQKLILGCTLLGSILVVCYVVFVTGDDTANGQVSPRAAPENPIDPQRCYGYLKDICAFGRRPTASPGMKKQQDYLIAHFQKLGATVTPQNHTFPHPDTGEKVTMTNLIVTWHPKKQSRVLLCAHYDTRPFPSEDKINPRGEFIGANDGGSGVAVLCELANHMPKLKSRWGVDFVLFDAEEFLFDSRRDQYMYFLGSKYFADVYRRTPPRHRYRSGVVLDMVGDKELQLYREQNSMRRPRAREIVYDIWRTAKRLGVKEFIGETKYEIRDDHLALNAVGIPTCDIIDFDYPRPNAANQYWHTTEDTLEKCSGESLSKVTWVMLEWLKQN
ncbi:MAG: glutaminyl-peptide cyclotransferase [Pirellulaceae bacterium]|jgi:glutaminyl-peptide cyclotransferase